MSSRCRRRDQQGSGSQRPHRKAPREKWAKPQAGPKGAFLRSGPRWGKAQGIRLFSPMCHLGTRQFGIGGQGDARRQKRFYMIPPKTFVGAYLDILKVLPLLYTARPCQAWHHHHSPLCLPQGHVIHKRPEPQGVQNQALRRPRLIWVAKRYVWPGHTNSATRAATPEMKPSNRIGTPYRAPLRQTPAMALMSQPQLVEHVQGIVGIQIVYPDGLANHPDLVPQLFRGAQPPPGHPLRYAQKDRGHGAGGRGVADPISSVAINRSPIPLFPYQFHPAMMSARAWLSMAGLRNVPVPRMIFGPGSRMINLGLHAHVHRLPAPGLRHARHVAPCLQRCCGHRRRHRSVRLGPRPPPLLTIAPARFGVQAHQFRPFVGPAIRQTMSSADPNRSGFGHPSHWPASGHGGLSGILGVQRFVHGQGLLFHGNVP